MKKRYLYTLLFALPGLAIALILATLTGAGVAGGLWLFVFGDSPWPALTGTLLPALCGLVFLAFWGGSLVWGYRLGKRLEADPGLDRRHLWWSAGLTLALLLLIGLQQWRVAHPARASDSLLCSDYCRNLGYPASELTPRDAGERICSCLDPSGQKLFSTYLTKLSNREQ